jgi:type II secretory pathway component HofQ
MLSKMRWLLLSLLLTLQVWAKPKLVNLEYHEADLPAVLRQLAQQLGYNLYVGPEVQGSVTISARQVPLDGAIALILKGQSQTWEYRQVGNTVVIGSPEKMKRFP